MVIVRKRRKFKNFSSEKRCRRNTATEPHPINTPAMIIKVKKVADVKDQRLLK
jgi:hypothetical protein